MCTKLSTPSSVRTKDVGSRLNPASAYELMWITKTVNWFARNAEPNSRQTQSWKNISSPTLEWRTTSADSATLSSCIRKDCITTFARNIPINWFFTVNRATYPSLTKNRWITTILVYTIWRLWKKINQTKFQENITGSIQFWKYSPLAIVHLIHWQLFIWSIFILFFVIVGHCWSLLMLNLVLAKNVTYTIEFGKRNVAGISPRIY